MDKNEFIEKLASDLGFMRQIRKRVLDHNMADDVLQKTLIKICENWDKLRDTNKVYPWVFQIMKNEALKSVLEEKRLCYSEIPDNLRSKNSGSCIELCSLLKKTLIIKGFYTKVEYKVAEFLIHETIAGIPGEMIMKNISTTFSFKMNYVTSLLYRIRNKINKHLQENGYQDHLQKRKVICESSQLYKLKTSV